MNKLSKELLKIAKNLRGKSTEEEWREIALEAIELLKSFGPIRNDSPVSKIINRVKQLKSKS